MMRIMLFMSAVLCCALLSGCRTPSSGITVESYPSTKIIVNSKMLAKRLQITEYNAIKVNAQLHLQIEVQNTTQKDVSFEYRVEWKDQNGLAIDTPLTTWIPFSLGGREAKSLKAIAPSDKAEDFIFIVRFGRPSTRW